MIILGDAMNMRHPLTGGGMTVVVLLSELLSPETVPDLGDTKLVLQQMSKFHWRRKHLTSVINILAQALYSLFAANGTYTPPKPLHANKQLLTLPEKTPSSAPWKTPLFCGIIIIIIIY
jgi:2-polyprenyl-6-methoxyphenol hydroxylase-like FAD-dependent oxidoreductase